MARFTRAIQDRKRITSNILLVALDGPGKPGHDSQL
jgi:hypothetical protein